MSTQCNEWHSRTGRNCKTCPDLPANLSGQHRFAAVHGAPRAHVQVCSAEIRFRPGHAMNVVAFFRHPRPDIASRLALARVLMAIPWQVAVSTTDSPQRSITAEVMDPARIAPLFS